MKNTISVRDRIQIMEEMGQYKQFLERQPNLTPQQRTELISALYVQAFFEIED